MENCQAARGCFLTSDCSGSFHVFFFCFVYFKADHVYILLNWPGLEFLCYAWGPEVRWIAHLQSQGGVRRLTPTDRCPKDSNPGPLDPKSSILPLSHRPPRVIPREVAQENPRSPSILMKIDKPIVPHDRNMYIRTILALGDLSGQI